MSENSETRQGLSYSFEGKRVLVTGGGGGIGKALVKRFYNDGAIVFTLEKNATLVEELRKEFPKITAETADITNWTQTQQIIDSFGPMDHLVNNAGIILFDDFINQKEELVDSVINVNLKSVYCTSQAVARGMIAKEIHGTIVNIASVGAHMITPRLSVYCATKAAVKMLTKCMAYELGKYHIRVNSVSPAGVETAIFRAFADDVPERKSSMENRQPLAGKTIMQPDDIVDSVLFLLSPLSAITTGTDLLVDGGVATC